MIPEKVHARHLVDLDFLQRYMEEIGMETNLIEKSAGLPLNVLLVGIEKDSRERDRVVNFTFLPTSDEELEYINLLQMYAVVPCDFTPAHKESLEKLLLAINAQMVLGHFGIRENNEVYYRYIYAVPKSELLNKEQITELLVLFIFALDSYGELIDHVAAGGKDIAEALEELAGN